MRKAHLLSACSRYLGSVGRGSCRAGRWPPARRLDEGLAPTGPPCRSQAARPSAHRLGLLVIVCTIWRVGTSVCSSAAGIPLGEVVGGQLKEISGLAASRRHPGILWVHNDGSDGRLFAVRTNGQTAAVLELATRVTDLEDIAVGPGPLAGAPHLYLGDIGDNNNQRPSIQVYRLPEPDLPSGTTAKKPAMLDEFETISLRYPDGAHDAEALLCDPRTGDVLVATKQKRKSRVYLAPGDRLRNGAEVAMRFIAEVPVADVSGGDLSPGGQSLLLRRENGAWRWARGPDETVALALAKPPQRIAVVGPPAEPNGEAIGWSADGRGYFTLSEGKHQSIYYFPSDPDLPAANGR